MILDDVADVIVSFYNGTIYVNVASMWQPTGFNMHRWNFNFSEYCEMIIELLIYNENVIMKQRFENILKDSCEVIIKSFTEKEAEEYICEEELFFVISSN